MKFVIIELAVEGCAKSTENLDTEKMGQVKSA